MTFKPTPTTSLSRAVLFFRVFSAAAELALAFPLLPLSLPSRTTNRPRPSRRARPLSPPPPAPPWVPPQTIALTGAGFSYGLIVGSAIHLFFAMVEVSVSLDAHEGWLHESLADVWTDEEPVPLRRGGRLRGLLRHVLPRPRDRHDRVHEAVMADKDEPYQSFRERYGVGQNNQPNQTPGAAGV